MTDARTDGGIDGTSPTATAPWTVTTWNVHGAKGIDVTAIAGVIRAESPDAVAVQEIRRGDARRLARRLGMHRHWALKHYPYTWLVWWRAEGLATLTPHALVGADSAQISRITGRRWDWRRRIAQWSTIRRARGDAVGFFNVHLSPHDDAPARLDEARRVNDLATRLAHPLVVAGDFNDDDDTAIIAALPGVEHLAPPFTNPADAPAQVLDHVLAPLDAVDVSVTVPAGGERWAALSDHLPVTVRFRLP